MRVNVGRSSSACQVLRGQGRVVKVGMSSLGLKVGGQVRGRVKEVKGRGQGAVGFIGGEVGDKKRMFLSRTHDRIPFHSNPIHSIPCFTQCQYL